MHHDSSKRKRKDNPLNKLKMVKVFIDLLIDIHGLEHQSAGFDSNINSLRQMVRLISQHFTQKRKFEPLLVSHPWPYM